VRFGPFELNTRTGELFKGGRRGQAGVEAEIEIDEDLTWLPATEQLR
jgi:hypothetical protein